MQPGGPDPSALIVALLVLVVTLAACSLGVAP